jgi:PKD repeat protein
MKKIYKRNWLFELKSLAVMGTLLFAGTAAAQLSGTYSVNSAGGADYTSLTAVVDALNSNGVSGAVTINVVASSGPYAGALEFDDVTGTATNTIVFNGNGTTVSTNGSRTIEISECEYLTINDFVISNTGNGSQTRCVQIRDESDYVNITNCKLNMPNMTNTSYSNMYLYIGNGTGSPYSYSSAGSNCLIQNNETNGPVNAGPYWGMFTADQNSNSDTDPNKLDNNDIKNWLRYGFRSYYADVGFEFTNNDVHNTGNTTNNYMYGVYIYSYFAGGEMKITGNKVFNLANGGTNSKYGMYIYGYYAGGSSKSLIANNIIDLNGAGFTYGLYVYAPFATGFNVIHNTVNIIKNPGQNSTSTIYAMYTGYTGGLIQNNIIYSNVNKTSGTFYGIYGFDAGGIGINNWDNNNMYLDDITGTGNVYHARHNGTYSTYSDMVAGFGTDWINESVAYVDRSTQDYRMTAFGIGNLGKPYAGVTTDVNGVTRSTTAPDLGATEYDLDFSVTSIDISTNASECGNFSTSVGITIKNENTFAVANVPVAYDINGSGKVSEVITANVAAGASSSYTFGTDATFNKPGTNVVSAFLDGNDDNTSNNSDNYSFSIVSSPTGGSLAQGSTFDGYFNAGTKNDPDVTVNTYASTYDISRPTGLGAPGAASYAYSLAATNDFGVDVTASGFSLNSEDFSADPATTLAGDTIFMEVSVLDANTGCDTSFGRWIYVPHTPVASFNSANICLGDVAQFKNTSTLGGADYIVTRWEFDDPDASITDDNSDIKDGFWEYSTYGNGVTVEMTVANGVYPKFEYPTTNTINVTPTPEIDFKVLNACEGTPITIANSTTLPTASPITYTWDFGGVGTSTLENPSYTFATPGIREVTVVASANGCESTLTKNAYQFEKPIASFTNTGECNFVDVAFMSTSTIPNEANMGYSWDFNGSGISREESPAFAFATPGTKSVTLTATSEFGCVDAITQNISLNESPVADFDWEKACNLTPIAFNFTGSVPAGNNSSYSWDFAGEATASRVDPEAHLFSKVGTKLVTLTIADLNGCTNTITKEVNVVLQALADFEAASVCEGAEAVFTNKSEVAAGGLSYKWSFGDGPTSTSEDLSPTHTYGEARTYNVTLEAIVEGGCSDLITKDVVVNPSPIAAFAPNKDGRTVVPTATQSGNDAYRWTFGDGGSSSEENPTYTYVNVDEGTYTVCLATREGDCWNENCEDITISLLGIANLTESDDMINVYPNPTTGKFTISVDNASEVVVKVGDILGNVLDIEVRDNLNGEYSVDMSAVADGVYFVQVRNGDFYATKRITVSK